MRPHVFTIAKLGSLVGDGATDSVKVTLHAIAKTNEKVDRCIANEYIAAGLGRFLGIPVAPGAVVLLSHSPKTYGYACLRFNLVNEALPDIDPGTVVQKLPRLATGLVVFDILIANPDRHEGNASFVTHAASELLVFDHSHALLGYDSNESITRLKQLRDRLGNTGGIITDQNRHCLFWLAD